MKMNFIVFEESERVNIELIDNQHLKISMVMNNIYNFTIKNKIDKVVKELKNLTELLKIHFQYEESLMKETKFGGYYSHKLEHDRLHKKIDMIAQNFESNPSLLNTEELNNLKNWFHNHLEISDKKCGEHFVAMGIK